MATSHYVFPLFLKSGGSASAHASPLSFFFPCQLVVVRLAFPHSCIIIYRGDCECKNLLVPSSCSRFTQAQPHAKSVTKHVCKVDDDDDTSACVFVFGTELRGTRDQPASSAARSAAAVSREESGVSGSSGSQDKNSRRNRRDCQLIEDWMHVQKRFKVKMFALHFNDRLVQSMKELRAACNSSITKD